MGGTIPPAPDDAPAETMKVRDKHKDSVGPPHHPKKKNFLSEFARRMGQVGLFKTSKEGNRKHQGILYIWCWIVTISEIEGCYYMPFVKSAFRLATHHSV